ncbi:hypothetical protein F511_38230 [Dorcoceras hygrometricum]|uniref:Uncharacterized protein n=1 Tax=Dorcoceras hygrometricum TaxID=472368 RepID=A0A2Z7ABI2_9LAMI|nr:hypothetical protein F511_38230 [Dorcoceras hygrometricum]
MKIAEQQAFDCIEDIRTEVAQKHPAQADSREHQAPDQKSEHQAQAGSCDQSFEEEEPVPIDESPIIRVNPTLRTTLSRPFLKTMQAAVDRQSGPRPDSRHLRQPALEGLTNSARMETPQSGGRNKSGEGAAATALGGGRRRREAWRGGGGRNLRVGG